MRAWTVAACIVWFTACGGVAPKSGDGGSPQADGGTITPTSTGGTADDLATNMDAGNVDDSGTAHPDGSTHGKTDGGTTAGTADLTGLQTSGGHIVNGAGAIVSLHGADHSYTEDTCTYGGFSDGHLTQTDLDVMKAWHMNAVRVPLNEDCMLGINGVTTGGSKYTTALQAYVKLITTNGFAVILDLHWTGPGTQLSNIGQMNMADADHAPAFWTAVATQFASSGAKDTSINSQVIFDLFNEPYLTDWSCWLKGVDAKGDQCPLVDQKGKTYAGDMAGMAQMLKAVRKTGAQNVVMIGGLAYSSNETSWVTYIKQLPTLAAPNDGLTTDNLAVSCHMYDFNYTANGEAANGQTGAQIGTNTGLDATLAAGFPFVIGETGNQMYNSASWLTGTTGLLTWADSQKQGYTVWSWNTDTSPVLLKSFPTSTTQAVTAYTTTMGQTYYDYLQKL